MIVSSDEGYISFYSDFKKMNGFIVKFNAVNMSNIENMMEWCDNIIGNDKWTYRVISMCPTSTFSFVSFDSFDLSRKSLKKLRGTMSINFKFKDIEDHTQFILTWVN